LKKKISKRILIIVTVITPLLLGGVGLSSCSLHHDDSGDLGGYWHLTGIDTLATNGHCDMSKEPVFWSVQGAILEARDVDKGEFVMFRYNRENGLLSLYDARYNNREIGDEQITDVAVLQPYGINKLEESFTVEALSSSRMILRSDMLKLYFKKF
jgi:hypothetical protein